ncbi:MAG: hypothetical protein VCA73_00120, partial [Roseibacillus sp.]
IDLVPDVVASERATAQRKPFLMAAAVILLAGLGVWAMHKSSLAATALDERTEMEKEKKTLLNPANKIDVLTKNQARLKEVGDAYADAQEMRTKWVEVLNKVKDYFNDQDVWITDFEPVGLYQVGVFSSAKPRIKENFPSVTYGTSVLEQFKRGGVAPTTGAASRRRRTTPAASGPAPPADAINAIRITGFWKEAPRAVHEIVAKIREDQAAADAVFTLKKPGPKGADFTDKEIFPVFKSNIGDPNELAEQFVMILPLKTPISIK